MQIVAQVAWPWSRAVNMDSIVSAAFCCAMYSYWDTFIHARPSANMPASPKRPTIKTKLAIIVSNTVKPA